MESANLSAGILLIVLTAADMIESGIDSLKIEGRIKGAYYAACATKVYREAVDRYYADPKHYETDPRWLELLDKVVHRDYDTGFFYNSPSEDAKIDSSKSYNKPAFVVGVVESSDESTGLIKVTQKNKFYKGDVLNVLMPEGYIDPVKVEALYDEKMNEIDSCPHPEMTVYIKTDHGILPELSFLSRDGDKDYGILPG